MKINGFYWGCVPAIANKIQHKHFATLLFSDARKRCYGLTLFMPPTQWQRLRRAILAAAAASGGGGAGRPAFRVLVVLPLHPNGRFLEVHALYRDVSHKKLLS